MKITRRDFIKSSLVLGGSLLLPRTVLSAPSRKKQDYHPAYAELERDGLLAPRIEQAYSFLRECELCPRQCGANRLKGERGFCRAPKKVVIYIGQPHFGEEISLVGQHGSGTIFCPIATSAAYSVRTGP